MSEIPYAIRDAWAITPPCESHPPYCHRECPYFGECGLTEHEYEDEDSEDSIE